MVLLKTFVEAFYAFCSVFLVSELGERLTIAYDEIPQVIEQFDCYLFPIEVQRRLPVLMLNAQQSVTLQCFGSTSTNREAFKKVLIRSKEEKKKNSRKNYNCPSVRFRW